MIFTRVVEYPLVLVAACFLLPRTRPSEDATPNAATRGFGYDLLGSGLVGGLTAVLVLTLLPGAASGSPGASPHAALPGALRQRKTLTYRNWAMFYSCIM
jgi:hypothetical protein